MGDQRRYSVLLELLLDMRGNRNRRNSKSPSFMRFCGIGRGVCPHGFQDRPVMTTSVTLHVLLLASSAAGGARKRPHFGKPPDRKPDYTAKRRRLQDARGGKSAKRPARRKRSDFLAETPEKGLVISARFCYNAYGFPARFFAGAERQGMAEKVRHGYGRRE